MVLCLKESAHTTSLEELREILRALLSRFRCRVLQWFRGPLGPNWVRERCENPNLTQRCVQGEQLLRAGCTGQTCPTEGQLAKKKKKLELGFFFQSTLLTRVHHERAKKRSTWNAANLIFRRHGNAGRPIIGCKQRVAQIQVNASSLLPANVKRHFARGESGSQGGIRISVQVVQAKRRALTSNL